MTAHDPYRENLPLYAVGAPPREESEPLERHLAECSECREELRAFNEVAAQIAMAVQPAAPRLHLREELLARLQGQPPAPAARVRDGRSVHVLRPRPIWFWAPAVAAAILLVVSAALWRREGALSQANRQLTAKLEAGDAAAQQARELISLLTAGGAQRITLVAAGVKPQPEAKAVYSSRQRGLVMLASNLNALPEHKTYELWLLPADGTQPVPAGTFKPDERGSATLVLSRFERAVPAKGFAVTVENEPGSAVPTMPIVISGAT